jgi:hypothetical protein
LLLQGERHESAGDCIRALRKALLRQREVAQGQSYAVSTRFLAILEQLAQNPDVGVEYCARVPGQPEDIVAVSHQQVAGVFAALYKKLHELGDWSPLQELRDQNKELKIEIEELRRQITSLG